MEYKPANELLHGAASNEEEIDIKITNPFDLPHSILIRRCRSFILFYFIWRGDVREQTFHVLSCHPENRKLFIFSF